MQPTLSRPPKTMLAYGILDESEELALKTIEALIRLAAGNAGVNVANVGISSFAILTAVAHPIANSRWAGNFIPFSVNAKQQKGQF
ncbi:hypothetical protein [Collinsella aerofaciens]|uniref:hypothetical protein n=1 Tax=Collinsella aerofaciens TaxID=74426 RepID=UPI00359C26D1